MDESATQHANDLYEKIAALVENDVAAPVDGDVGYIVSALTTALADVLGTVCDDDRQDALDATIELLRATTGEARERNVLLHDVAGSA